MILHCTQKLFKKIPLTKYKHDSNESRLAPEINPLGSWHANLYIIDRRNCVMFCHDRTRFMLFIPGLVKKDFEVLDRWFRDLFVNTMSRLDYDEDLIFKADNLLGDIRFDTICDRSVQGTMRAAKLQDIEGWLMNFSDVIDMPMYSLSARLCDRPVRTKGMKYGECLWPKRDMKELLERI